MIDLNDYFYFVHVVEKQGFSPAALALNMPKSRLSRHIKQLEERLDSKLIQRTSRQFKITDTGRLFYRHARALLDEMEMAEAAVQSTKKTLSGTVKISCSLGVAQFAVKQLLVEFLKENPKVNLVQQVTNQTVDLVSNGIDIAIRGHIDQLPDSSIIQRQLTTVSWQLFASPAYIESHGAPSSPDDLLKQKSLKMGWQSTSGIWTLENQEGLEITVPYRPQLCSDDMSTLKKAAIDGLGIVSLPAYTCRDAINTGLLTRVLPNWTTGKAKLSLLTLSRRGQPPAVQVLSDYLVSNLHSHIGDQ
ncbi:LysR substrate-binding domain-containing protein [Idiomarina sp. ST10R2A5]|uniref:LysR substrate-binding domain-containing protein n=1 Tax=Idiomarina sp. ST10R2A5 TaxID=3418368 RepID=UPI003EC8851C